MGKHRSGWNEDGKTWRGDLDEFANSEWRHDPTAATDNYRRDQLAQINKLTAEISLIREDMETRFGRRHVLWLVSAAFLIGALAGVIGRVLWE